MSDCPHGYPSRASCVDCMADGPVTDPPRWQAVGGPFTAGFPAECPGCDAAIAPGVHRVQRYDLGDERTVYVHAAMGCRPR